MISAKKLKILCADKKVFIWGAMIVGQGVCRSLERVGIRVEAFLDSSPSLQGNCALGYPILKPDSMFDTIRAKEGIIIVSSGHCDLEIGDICESVGILKNEGYIFCRDLNNIDPSVDVSGVCNLHCISCPQGNEIIQPLKGFMSAATYKKVLDKLLKEIPLLGSIQLYTWGEPLLNPELPKIITMTREAKVLSAISSNLNYSEGIERVVASCPDWFKISCSGWGESYELTHSGGKWDIFLANIKKLAKLRDKLHPEMQITVNYHLYKHNIQEDYFRMEELCNKLSLIFRPSPAYLYPADTVMDFIDGKGLSEDAKKTIPLLMMSLEDGLVKARERTSLPCPEERCFPINWDCRVRTCGIFFRPYIAENFLETPIMDIIEKKKKSQLCIECKKRGIHQFTGVYLAEKRISNVESTK